MSFNAFRNYIQFIDMLLNVVPGVTFACRTDGRHVSNPIPRIVCITFEELCQCANLRLSATSSNSLYFFR